MTPSDRSILWELCFGDAPDVAESFLEIGDIITLEEYSDNKLVGMASLVPVSTHSGASGFYAYGVCTHPDHRGRGVFTSLMKKCESEALTRELDFLCLIPATERLATTYFHMGYSKSIALYDAPIRDGEAIFSTSRKFAEFATPEGDDAIPSTLHFGLMKPLTERAEMQEFHFAAPMGER